jgi:hypothetical protein
LIALGYDGKTLLYVFWVGCTLAFMMEFALLVSGIRSTNFALLVYETLILTNQGVPYLYVIRDRIVPLWCERVAAQKAAQAFQQRDVE